MVHRTCQLSSTTGRLQRMMKDRSRVPRSATILFGWASLGAVASGCYVMAAAHTGSAFWLRNVMAWVAGALLAFALFRVRFSPKFAVGTIVVCIAALMATILGAGEMGVHRWVNAGPLHINVAALVLPLLLVALSVAPPNPLIRFGSAIFIIVLLYLQPDASQASAFAMAVVLLMGFESSGTLIGRMWVAAIFTLAAATWLRRDPLPSVPEVEGIIGLAWRLSPAIAVSALVCLAVTVASPLILVPRGPAARVAIASSSYFAISALAPFCSIFPVPLVGAGMSSIVGFWIGIGSLGALHRYLASSRNPITPAERPETSDRSRGDGHLIALARTHLRAYWT